MAASVSGTARAGLPARALGAVRGLSRTWALFVGGALVAGIALRVWILAGPLGMAESDEAIVGLMSEDVLDGTFHVFYWVNYYSGTQEVLLTAALFALVGSSVVAMKVVPAILIGLACLVTWRIGRLTVGEPAARIGAALMWVSPPFLVFWSTKARSAYGIGLLCAAVVLWMALRLRERNSRLDAAVLGFALGCGVWSTQQSLLMALPAVAWLVWRRPGVLRLSHYAVAGGVVGGSPWIIWNLTHGLKGVLPVTSVAGEESTYFSRLGDLFTIVLPEWLGVRLPYSKDWLVWAPLGVVLTAAAVTLLLVAFARRPRGAEPLLVIAAVYPFLYAATSFTFFTDEPRYLTFIAPVPALLLATLLRRPRVAVGALAVAVAWTAFYLVRLEDQGRFRYLGQPANIGPLITLLEKEGQDRVFADYWIAYRLDFESGERIIATSTGFVRNQEYDELVKADPSPAYVYVEGSPQDDAARLRLEPRGYSRVTSGGWTAYVRR
jgi:Dolichyl-phosphate-mannose-protein mannosyltransferase